MHSAVHITCKLELAFSHSSLSGKSATNTSHTPLFYALSLVRSRQSGAPSREKKSNRNQTTPTRWLNVHLCLPFVYGISALRTTSAEYLYLFILAYAQDDLTRHRLTNSCKTLSSFYLFLVLAAGRRGITYQSMCCCRTIAAQNDVQRDSPPCPTNARLGAAATPTRHNYNHLQERAHGRVTSPIQFAPILRRLHRSTRCTRRSFWRIGSHVKTGEV